MQWVTQPRKVPRRFEWKQREGAASAAMEHVAAGDEGLEGPITYSRARREPGVGALQAGCCLEVPLGCRNV